MTDPGYHAILPGQRSEDGVEEPLVEEPPAEAPPVDEPPDASPWVAEEKEIEDTIAKLQTTLADLRKRRGAAAGGTDTWARGCSDHSDRSLISLAPGLESVEDVLHNASESEASANTSLKNQDQHRTNRLSVAPSTNVSVLRGSALAKSRLMQTIIYLAALAGVVFVLVARSTNLGENVDGSASGSVSGAHDDGAEAHARRLGGGASQLMIQIASCIASAGLLAFAMNTFKLPLILGYLLGGVLVGPIGLDIVHTQADIAELSSLGLVFLLFMIGLELDVSELLKMGKVVIFTGLLQFPLCAAIMFGVFSFFEAIGVSWGSGSYAALYVGMPCGISSTMIVVKLLSEQADMDTVPGRLTIGILIFQDIWAIVVLAIQPDLANPQVLGILKTFVMIVGLTLTALAYAKFVMPAVFVMASKSIELMLIIALAWCFFMCSLATLPFVGLSMELAALISGVALATFPYSAEFNGKIKYIRDFFITLFFVGLGMQIPMPSAGAIMKAVLVAVVVMAVRWIGIFSVVLMLGGGSRLAAVSTINLSQISEFALVICSLGMSYGHIDEETLTILIWTFSILAVASSYMISSNYAIYGMLSSIRRRIRGTAARAVGDTLGVEVEGDDHVDRNIVILGFHKIAAMLIAHFEHHNPHLLAKLHVIDFHEHIMPELRRRGVTCAYGDISSPDVLEHAHHGEVRLVISSISDSQLRGVTNLRLLQISKQVWPQADVIVSADTPKQARVLYDAGADYVLRTAKICAERLHDLISDHSTHTTHHHHVGEEVRLNHAFLSIKEREKDQDEQSVVSLH